MKEVFLYKMKEASKCLGGDGALWQKAALKERFFKKWVWWDEYEGPLSIS